MGVSFHRMVALLESGYLQGERPRVLDIGCSNLHSVEAEELKRFVSGRGGGPPELLDQWARYAAAGGVMDPEIGGTNGAWLGDMLERAGYEYTSFDIFAGYKTELFDLNTDVLPEQHRNRYDLVLNFGTTEHVLGQYNAFKIIHEATAVGGVICHDLPMAGHLDHGFFNYNPMLLIALAEANGYEILKLSFSGALGEEAIGPDFERRYGSRDYLHFEGRPEEGWLASKLPTASVGLVARKRIDAPFRASLETSTTVGSVVNGIEGHYGADRPETGDLQVVAKARVGALLHRLFDPTLTMGEMNHAYNGFVGSGLTQGFPLSLERRMLDGALAETPNADLVARRAVVEELLRQQRPLLKAADAAGVPAPGLAFDGVEADFDLSGDEAAVFRRIVAAYAAYRDRLAVELFPIRLEAIALERWVRTGPRDPDVLIRTGQVMAQVSPALGAAA